MIGDLALMVSKGAQVPGVAQGAIQGGRHVAKQIAAEAKGGSARKPFSYWDKGNMATIGRASAVVATKSVAISGVFAWLMWWVVHIFFLVGFKNRFVVMIGWLSSWLSYKRGARLITGTIRPLPAIRAIGPGGETVMPPAAAVIAVGIGAAAAEPRAELRQ